MASSRRTLRVLSVYRYKSTGKLVLATGYGRVLPLNSDLSFSSKPAHRVRRDTELEDTRVRIEVEEGQAGDTTSFMVVRRWNLDDLPAKSSDPSAPLEYRIDVSPAESLTADERRFSGARDSHFTAFLLGGASAICLLLPLMSGGMNWYPTAALAAVLAACSAAVALGTKRFSDPRRLAEIAEAKERIRARTRDGIESALRNIKVWEAMDGVTFEHNVARIFRQKGYAVATTPRSFDRGVDLILTKDAMVTIVQCKAHSSTIGAAPVRELHGARAQFAQASNAMVVALFEFSPEARRFAEQYGIELFSIARDHLRTTYRPTR